MSNLYFKTFIIIQLYKTKAHTGVTTISARVLDRTNNEVTKNEDTLNE